MTPQEQYEAMCRASWEAAQKAAQGLLRDFATTDPDLALEDIRFTGWTLQPSQPSEDDEDDSDWTYTLCFVTPSALFSTIDLATRLRLDTDVYDEAAGQVIERFDPQSKS